MIRSLFTAATGMNAQQLNIDNISNNIANVNTNGYKKSRMDFEDLIYQNLIMPGGSSSTNTMVPTGMQIGMGVRPASTQKIFSQGDFQQTLNPLDLVIEGKGFFQITQPDGTIAYTRAGSFKLSPDGVMQTAHGDPLEPQITIPPNAIDITIGRDGTVSVDLPGQIDPQIVGNIEIATFVNPAGLKAIGKNLFTETSASGNPTILAPGQENAGELHQGFIEMSNVNIVEEMVNMIIGQRAYEINSKSIQTADELLRRVNELKR